MTSRLDRLFVLLEAGAGAATRRAAARQLGEVQKAHPEELHRLLERLMKHLRSPAWETRIAATQAVEAILSNVPEWHPPPFSAKEEELDQEESGRLRCETFDIERVLEHGAHLMGSEGHEYDLDEEALSATDMNDRLAKQRQQLNTRLGLDVAASLGVDLSGVYTNEDLCPVKAPVKPEVCRRPVQELVLSKGLSSREMNLAKRKARLAFSKQKSRDCEDSPSTPTTAPSTPTTPLPCSPCEPERKKIKLEQTDDAPYQIVEVSSGAVPGRDGSWGEGTRWPLGAWAGALTVQLLNGAWEARHGAASALRELLRTPVVTSAGCRGGMTREQMEDAHQEWLEDMALRLLCVLALDRFGDFVSDQVVAPVRETSAQALGVCLSRLRAGRVLLVGRSLAALAQHQQWEARHGALLAFKYLLAARKEVALECGALEHLMAGLEDSAEDVSGVAAGALASAASALASARVARPARLAARLWALLRDRDDLAAPAHAYMALLAALMALPEAAEHLHPIDLADVLPRLWPYLDHSTSSVRKATLQTLRTITRPLITETKNGQTNGDKNEKIISGVECDVNENQKKGEEPSENEENTDKKCNESKNNCEENGNSNLYLQWTPELLQETMRHIYQRVLFEHVHDIQEIAMQVWENLLQYAELGVILVAACPLLALWLCLAMQPARLPLEPALLLHTPTKERRVRASGCVSLASTDSEARSSQKWYLGGSESQPAALRDANVTRARCLAAETLGYLSCYLVKPAPGIEYKAEDESPIDCYVRVMVVYLRSGSALQRLVCGLVLAAWARRTQHHGLYPPHLMDADAGVDDPSVISRLAPPTLVSVLHAALGQTLYYDEVALNCNRILQEARDLLAMMKHYKLPVDNEEYSNIVRLEQVSALAAGCEAAVSSARSKRVAASLEERRVALLDAARTAAKEHAALAVAVQAALSSAVAYLAALPERLNPVVRPLMESIKKESSEELQRLSANTLAALLGQLVNRQTSPNNKVLANLKAFLSCDPEFTPRISLETTEEVIGDSGSGDSGAEAEGPASQGPVLDKYEGILTLREQQRSAERLVSRRGRPPSHAQAHAHNDVHIDQLFPQEDEARKLLRIQRRGATMALTSLTEYFGDDLPEKLPKLWEFIIEPFEKVMTDEELQNLPEEVVEELISRLQVVEAVGGSVGRGERNTKINDNAHKTDANKADDSDSKLDKEAGSEKKVASDSRSEKKADREIASDDVGVGGGGRVWARLVGGVGAGAALSRARHTALRHMAARALAALAQRDPHALMRVLVNEVSKEIASDDVGVGGGGRVWARLVGGVGAGAALSRARHTALRHMAARALAALAQRDPHALMRVLVNEVSKEIASDDVGVGGGGRVWARLVGGVGAGAALSRARHTALRHMAARALAALAQRDPHALMRVLVNEVSKEIASDDVGVGGGGRVWARLVGGVGAGAALSRARHTALRHMAARALAALAQRDPHALMRVLVNEVSKEIASDDVGVGGGGRVWARLVGGVGAGAALSRARHTALRHMAARALAALAQRDPHALMRVLVNEVSKEIASDDVGVGGGGRVWARLVGGVGAGAALSRARHTALRHMAARALAALAQRDPHALMRVLVNEVSKEIASDDVGVGGGGRVWARLVGGVGAGAALSRARHTALRHMAARALAALAQRDPHALMRVLVNEVSKEIASDDVGVGGGGRVWARLVGGVGAGAALSRARHTALRHMAARALAALAQRDPHALMRVLVNEVSKEIASDDVGVGGGGRVWARLVGGVGAGAALSRARHTALRHMAARALAALAQRDPHALMRVLVNEVSKEIASDDVGVGGGGRVWARLVGGVGAGAALSRARHTALRHMAARALAALAQRDPHALMRVLVNEVSKEIASDDVGVGGGGRVWARLVGGVGAGAALSRARHTALRHMAARALAALAQRDPHALMRVLVNEVSKEIASDDVGVGGGGRVWARLVGGVGAGAALSRARHTALRHMAARALAALAQRDPHALMRVLVNEVSKEIASDDVGVGGGGRVWARLVGGVGAGAALSRARHTALRHMAARALAALAQRDPHALMRVLVNEVSKEIASDDVGVGGGGRVWARLVGGVGAGAALSRARHTALRHMAARALAALAQRDPHALMRVLVNEVSKEIASDDVGVGGGGRVWARLVGGVGAGAALSRARHTALRHMAARALAALAQRDPHALMRVLVNEVSKEIASDDVGVGGGGRVWARLVGGVGAGAALSRARHTALRHMAARALAALAQRDPHALMRVLVNEVSKEIASDDVGVGGGGRVWARLVGGVGAGAALSRARHTALRHMAARALAALAQRDPHALMRVLVNELVAALEHPRARVRCGAAEALARAVDALQLHVVPYIALLVVPLLGRMSDHNESVRTMSTRCFATLIQLMPLDGPAPAPPGLAPDMLARRTRDKHFLDQLFNPKSIKDYKIPIPVTAELRSYQQAGVNWLRFLNEYKLHGVLCDDMGLGKTLQSVVVVAGSHYELAKTGAPSLPSLVVCPPTLTGHWVFEVNKFIPSQYLKPLQYVGPPVERERLRAQVQFYSLIVASYDIVRKDIEFFSSLHWNYCILDEGHVIKNGKTKAFKAIKQIVANHRLILSGTPIQNNVLELWSLFDFLMPGLLGSERQFTARYSRPLLAARDPRASPHHLQAGALACEALHRQVLPFVLRRVKEDVLRELPPKITQDYYCELSPLQRRLYEHFSREHMPQDITHSHTHVFQALHYLQNVCNHPKLVLVESHPESARVSQQLAAAGSSLDDINHGAKLPALKQLLLDCGIGSSSTGVEAGAVVSQHRALIFCQLKKMLDIVEKDLLQKHLPSVAYLRLDGSVPPHHRHAIVTRFNTDVSIDVLLLTTAVGGLGLNLTGADTVIFVEHDWNPMKDLQAMDRAHRIGQKKVVNVYRLITRDTLEEKIMGLQKFKMMTANTVISSENAAMETMGTDQLLDLFQSGTSKPSGSGAGPSGVQSKSLIETLPDLWDDKLYEEEYDMTNFVKGLRK